MCPPCSQNAHDETVLVRCAQSRAALATPLKRGKKNWKILVGRAQWETDSGLSPEIKQEARLCVIPSNRRRVDTEFDRK